MRRRYSNNKKELEDFLIRFYPAGTYTWTVPDGCFEVDVFLVGGGGSASASGGGGGYTATYKASGIGYKDGNAIPVTPGQIIPITVGKGGNRVYTSGTDVEGKAGTASQFMNSKYVAKGGGPGHASTYNGGNGGSGGAAYPGTGGSDGGDAYSNTSFTGKQGVGQHHTTRDFGEPDGKRNAGGGGGQDISIQYYGGESDYEEGKGGNGGKNGGYAGYGGGGYGGGGGAYRGWSVYGGAGGDGTVLIRGKRFKQS